MVNLLNTAYWHEVLMDDDLAALTTRTVAAAVHRDKDGAAPSPELLSGSFMLDYLAGWYGGLPIPRLLPR